LVDQYAASGTLQSQGGDVVRNNQTVLGEVRGWLAGAKLAGGERLPPERELASRLGMSRADLRKALAVLEAEGRVWRHVGKGTFLTELPDGTQRDVAALADRTSPPEAMEARFVVEPEIARLAAIKATSAQIADLRQLCGEMRQARNWSEYESLDWRFHNLLAQASGNMLLAELQYIVNGVRRSVVWGHLSKRPVGPSPDYHSFAEHDAIVDAIARRDRRAASDAMRAHLNSTASTLVSETE
jgi:DNA-binding FadR family transcriptional regulator